ncbi:MAG: nucleoside-triphosphatase [Desulfotomaculales bacterium]
MTKKNIFLTGLPGSGKTTVITGLAGLLGDRASGFYTAEIRQKGRREGFEVVTLSGRRAVLAHVNFVSSFRVGRYGVDPESLKEAVSELKLSLARNEPKCLLIDEIGKMELFNPEFREAVLAALDSSFPVVATILAKPHPFCDALKERGDVKLIEVSGASREKLPIELYNFVAVSIGIRS